MSKLIVSLPSQWYRRINFLTASFSLLTIFSFIIFQFWSPFGLEDYFAFNVPVVTIAGMHFFFAFAVFTPLARRNAELAGVISYCLFTILAAVLVHTTYQTGSEYVVVWVLALFLSGIFGPLLLLSLTLLNTLYLSLILFGLFAAPSDFNIVLLILTLLTAGISQVLWSYLRADPLPSFDKHGGYSGTFVKEQIDTEILTSALTDGVVVVNDHGIIQMYNPAAAAITGWEARDTIGLDVRTVLALFNQKGERLAREDGPFARCLGSGEVVKLDSVWLQTRSERKIETSLTVSPIKGDGNSVLAAVAVFRDVSRERDQERQRAEFISTASHEMRTPVAAIEGYLALALNERVSKIDKVARGYLDKAHGATQHLGKLFQDLLTVSQSEDGRLLLRPRVFEVGHFLAELVDTVRLTGEQKGLTVELSGGAPDTKTGRVPTVLPIYYVQADPDRLREVVTNLFDNAVKYTQKGKVSVGMTADNDQVTISVTDTGAGIAKEDLPHLFQKFYRVDNSVTRDVGGTGLGLFIVRKTVELMGGQVWVESELGKGSTFFIGLPRVSAERAEEILQAEAKAAPAQKTV